MTEIKSQQTVDTQRVLTPADICTVSPAYWATYNEIRLQSGTFSLKDHEYQLEPMESKDKQIVVQKSTQAGFTEVFVLKTLHALIHNLFPQGLLYIFPTQEIVQDFGKSRFNPLITRNERAIGKFVKSTDSATLKKIGKAFLYLRSGRLSQKVDDDVDESSSLRSIPVDAFVIDEVDLVSEEIIEKAKGRLGHSRIGAQYFLSNPVLPGSGINRLFQQSDQRYWFRLCSCGAYTCSELSFPNCVKRDSEGKGYIACSKCGKPVGIAPGEWVAQVPSNAGIAGYQVSHLMSVFQDPWTIVMDVENPPLGNLADVYRLRLGLPYVATEDKLQESQVLNCCGDYLPMTGHPGPTAIGVDVGRVLHAVIGIRTGSDQYEIVRTMQVPSLDDLRDIFKRYNVKSACIDIRPYEDGARKIQSSCGFPCFLCEYSETQSGGPQFNSNSGIVKVNRTEILDRTHRMVMTAGMLKIPRICDETKLFSAQMCGTAKVSEKDKRSGTTVYRYRPVGTAGDHFRHALNYFALAASGGKLPRFTRGEESHRPRKAINTFRVGA
jgi:hypothetical protein